MCRLATFVDLPRPSPISGEPLVRNPERGAALGTAAVIALVELVLLVSVSRLACAGINIWTSNGPEGGIYALAIDPATPTTLYAGTGGGVFKSTNGGGNWSAVNTGLTNTNVYALAIDPATPTTLYAGTHDGGVFKSTNGGGNWSAVNTGLTDTVCSRPGD